MVITIYMNIHNSHQPKVVITIHEYGQNIKKTNSKLKIKIAKINISEDKQMKKTKKTPQNTKPLK